jgi:hypothetical protein
VIAPITAEPDAFEQLQDLHGSNLVCTDCHHAGQAFTFYVQPWRSCSWLAVDIISYGPLAVCTHSHSIFSHN